MARDQAYREAEKKIEVAQRKGTDKLSLSGIKLTKVPESLCQLTHLRSLNLSINELTALPKWLGQLTQLQSLNLSNNQLTGLPESLGQLTQLQSLKLSANQLTALPESLGQLTRLQQLNLRYNQLTDFPTTLVQLEHLKELDLHFNPLNPELAAAYKQGLYGVKTYLRAKAAAQITLNEAKLILIGEGEVGKSCLLGALRGDPWEEGRPTTHGIEIKPVKVTDSDSKREITLNGWDFGGQRVYRPTHQLFFSAPAVYLVVWKPREGPQQGFVKEWIQLVKRREPSARIIVVATHGGPQQRQPDIDRQELWDLFGKETIVDFFFVDSKPDEHGNRKGIAELKLAIARVAASLPEVGRSVPKSFADVRQTLQAKGVPYLPLDEVLAICRGHKMDDEIARLFIIISHRLGHLTHYENDPALRDIVILRPDWLATAMSYVLDDEQTRTAHGLVKFSRLGQLW
ncbi:MAG: COR domain-containing protein, partial [bacterium]